jgi:TolB protein
MIDGGGSRRMGIRARALARIALIVLIAAITAVPSGVRGQDTTRAQGVRIGLTYTAGTRPGVLITPMSGANADSVREILRRDLDFGDRVNPIKPDGDPPAGALNYPVYAQMGAAAVVQATVTAAGSLHIAIHDVAAARVMNVLDIPLPGAALGPDWRMAVHGASDEIERVITEQRGIAQTRVVFERGGNLWIVDSDGANPHPLAGTGSGLSPAWHPTGRYLAYCLMANDGMFIMLRDLTDGSSRRVPGRGASSTSPSFSPDGTTLVFASGSDGSDLYSTSAFGKEPLQRLTIGRGSVISQQPSFSPDGRRIAFQSDRSGHPEIYIMDADGTNADLLTSSTEGPETYRTNPDWSPDGRKIAFESKINGTFQIMTINVRDRSSAPLTSEGRNEDPSWAPDGRHLVFSSTRSGAKQLWVIDVESNRMRQLTHGDRARMGAWSPRLEAAR